MTDVTGRWKRNKGDSLLCHPPRRCIWSNRRLRREQGGTLTFRAAFWHTYALFACFWLYDLLLLDWLIFVTWTPAIAFFMHTGAHH